MFNGRKKIYWGFRVTVLIVIKFLKVSIAFTLLTVLKDSYDPKKLKVPQDPKDHKDPNDHKKSKTPKKLSSSGSF